jgi:hypothetical protein
VVSRFLRSTARLMFMGAKRAPNGRMPALLPQQAALRHGPAKGTGLRISGQDKKRSGASAKESS